LEELDCLGLRCPIPIIKVAKHILDKEVGYQILLLSDDPASAPDLAAWARMTKNRVEVKSANSFQITKLSN
jgi:tRNA 2-thiouridine synthesizing protein A